MRRNRTLLFILISAFLFITSLRAQNLSGTEGLLIVPSAEIIKDGSLSVGASYFEKEYLPRSFQYNALAYYVSVGFLPFMETGIRFTKNLGPRDALGDRMFNLKIKLLNESDYIPSVSFGLQDFLYSKVEKTNRFNASYFVLTKNFDWFSDLVTLKLNLGYGFRLFSALSYQFIGLFGGISFDLFDTVELVAEHEAEFTNAGFKLHLFGHLRLMAAFIDLKHISAGFNYSFHF